MFLPKKDAIFRVFFSLFRLFRHKKAQISPQIAEFRHKSPVLDTFSTRHCTMLYFCSVFIKTENEFLL